MTFGELTPAEKRERDADEAAYAALVGIINQVRSSIGGQTGFSSYAEERKAVDALNKYVDARVKIVLTEMLGTVIGES